MIVFCEECGQKHSIELDGDEKYLSEQRCNACGSTIKVPSLVELQEADIDQPVLSTSPVSFSLDQLMNEKNNLESFLEHAMEHALGKSNFFGERKKADDKKTGFLLQEKNNLDTFLTDIINNMQINGSAFQGSDSPADINTDTQTVEAVIGAPILKESIEAIESTHVIADTAFYDKHQTQHVMEAEKPAQESSKSTDQPFFASEELYPKPVDKGTRQFITMSDPPARQPFKSSDLKTGKPQLTKKIDSNKLSTLIIILLMVMVASLGIFSTFYYGIGETLYGYSTNIFDYIAEGFDKFLAICTNFMEYLLSLVGI